MTEYTFSFTLIEVGLYIVALGIVFGIAHVWDKLVH